MRNSPWLGGKTKRKNVFIVFFKYLLIYLAVLGLSSSIGDLELQLVNS